MEEWQNTHNIDRLADIPIEIYFLALSIPDRWNVAACGRV